MFNAVVLSLFYISIGRYLVYSSQKMKRNFHHHPALEKIPRVRAYSLLQKEQDYYIILENEYTIHRDINSKRLIMVTRRVEAFAQTFSSR